MLLVCNPAGFVRSFKDLSGPAETLERPPAPQRPPPPEMVEAMINRMGADGVVFRLS